MGGSRCCGYRRRQTELKVGMKIAEVGVAGQDLELEQFQAGIFRRMPNFEEPERPGIVPLAKKNPSKPPRILCQLLPIVRIDSDVAECGGAVVLDVDVCRGEELNKHRNSSGVHQLLSVLVLEILAFDLL